MVSAFGPVNVVVVLNYRREYGEQTVVVHPSAHMQVLACVQIIDGNRALGIGIPFRF